MVPEWMNWEGWRWISPIVGMGVGFWFGWDIRSTNARHDLWAAERAASRAGWVVGRAIDLISAAEFSRGPVGLVCTVPVDRINRLAGALAAINTDGKLAEKHPEATDV